MSKPGPSKYGAQLAVKIEQDELAHFIANAEACKSTKDIVVRELVYAFNRYCESEGGRFPVLQRLEVVAPGYIVNEDTGTTIDATIITRATESGIKGQATYPRYKKKRSPDKQAKPESA